jgi:hypothetical protein
MEFGPDHYTRDWDLLEGVAREWDALRTLHGFKSREPLEKIRRHLDAALDDKGSWPHIRRVREELERDAHRNLQIDTCFTERLTDDERQEFPFEQVLTAVLLRNFCTVLRNAGKWLARRKPEDEHWMRLRDMQNLTTELRRAIKDLRARERLRQRTETDTPQGQESHADQDIAPADTTPPLARLEVPRTGIGWAPVTNYKGQQTATPDQRLEALEDVLEGVAERDRRVFMDWWHNCQECSREEERAIEIRHGLAEGELNVILSRVAENRS